MTQGIFWAGCLLLIVAQACSDRIFIEGGPDLKGYGQVYIPQANQGLVVKNVELSNEVYELNYSAFLGGFDKADKDIHVHFGVAEVLVATYNEQHGTNYELLPAASYTLAQREAVIPKGSNTTPILQVGVTAKGVLEAFKPYLLPITIQSSDVRVSESQQTVYFEVTASFAPGEVPRQQVLELGDFEGGKLIGFVDGKLITCDAGGNLKLYEPNEDGTFGAPRQIGQGWQGLNNIFYFRPNRIVVTANDVVQFAVDADGGFGASRAIGYGWNIFMHIIPYEEYLIGIRPDGVTTSYEYTETGDIVSANIRDIATDWNGYDLVFQYGNSLIARQPDGKLWQIPMSAAGLPQTAQQRGSGWDRYVAIVASEDDLLALDAEGVVWRYDFVPQGFWPL